MAGEPFERVSTHLAVDDMVSSRQSPFDSVRVPDFLFKLIEDLKQQQSGRLRNGIEVKNAFLYGGSLPDLAVGNSPKDYDIYLHSPEWVEQMKRYIEACDNAYGFKETRELSDEQETWTVGYGCPVSPTTSLYKVKFNDLLGEYFEFSGQYSSEHGVIVIDLKVGTNAVGLPKYLAHTAAPIFAFGASLDDPDNVVYVYHKEGPTHLRNGVIVTELVSHPDLLEKAERKGWQIVRPSDLGPLNLRGHGHEDSLGVAAGLQAKLRPPVIE